MLLRCAAMRHAHPLSMPPLRLALLAAVIVAPLTACRDREAAPPAPVDPAVVGEQVYTMACVRCHGVDGGGGELAERLGGVPSLRTARVAELPTAELEALIRDGRGAMPPHGNRLAPEQITHVADYVRRRARTTR